jgi:hypothetical protein
MKIYRVEDMVLAIMVILQVRNPPTSDSLISDVTCTGLGKPRQSRRNQPTFAVSHFTTLPDIA